MGREWTERHIRELIKNEIIRIYYKYCANNGIPAGLD